MTVFLFKIALSALFLLLAAFFAGAETALMSLSRLQLGRLRKTRPGRLFFWEEDPDRVIAVLLVGNNLTHVGLGVLATSLAFDAEKLFGLPFRWGGWLLPAAAGLLVIVFGEVLPKVAARHFSEPLALAIAAPVRLLSRAMGPLLQAFLARTEALLGWLSRTVRAESAQWDTSVIRAMLAMSSVAPPLRSVLNNLVGFGNVPVSKVMVPPAEIFALDMGLPKQGFIDRALSSGYSRLPVYRGGLNEIAGIIYTKDLLAFWRTEALLVFEDVVRPALRIPMDMSLASLLREFRQGRHHMALVEDRNGRVQGLVTLQDVLEAIVGEIAEEPELKGPELRGQS